VLAPLAALLMGCAAGPAPGDHFYRLAPGDPQPLARPALAGSLAVERARADAAVSGLPLLYREGDAIALGRHQYRLWVDPPPVMLQGALVRWLRAAGVADAVSPAGARANADYVLESRILKLEHVRGDPPRGDFELEVRVVREEDGAELLLATYRESIPAGGAGAGAAVTALEAGLERALAQLLVDLAKLPAGS
jgi:ABC-type uncharacterized transport system auxiliary subunit